MRSLAPLEGCGALEGLASGRPKVEEAPLSTCRHGKTLAATAAVELALLEHEVARLRGRRQRTDAPAQTLVVHSMRAFDVPRDDPAGSSDPYLRLTLLEGGGDDAEADAEAAGEAGGEGGHGRAGGEASVRTRHLRNATNPVWHDRLYLALGAGGARPPRLRLELFDKDFTNDDDLLAAAEVRLGAEHDVSARLQGRAGLADCRVCFSRGIKLESALCPA